MMYRAMAVKAEEQSDVERQHTSTDGRRDDEVQSVVGAS